MISCAMCINLHGILPYLYVDKERKFLHLAPTSFIFSTGGIYIFSSLTIIVLGVNEDDDDCFDLCVSPLMIIFTLVYLQYFRCFFCNQSNNRVRYFSEKIFLRRGNHVQKESSSTKDLQKASIFYMVIESSCPTFHTFENSNRQVCIVLSFPRAYKKLALCLVEYGLSLTVWIYLHALRGFKLLIYIVIYHQLAFARSAQKLVASSSPTAGRLFYTTNIKPKKKQANHSRSSWSLLN